mgnify:CR=1 FL=1
MIQYEEPKKRDLEELVRKVTGFVLKPQSPITIYDLSYLQEFVKIMTFRQHNLLNCNRLMGLKALLKIISNALQRFTASRNPIDYV